MASPTAGGSSPGLIDTRAIGKLRQFSGKEEDWAAWVFVARGYVNLLDPGYQALLEASESMARHSDIRMADLGGEAAQKSVVLFNLLTQSVDGRALQVLMNVESGNGFQAWKALCETYEPDVGGRHTAMLMGIIAPPWESVKEADFLEAVETWEVQIRRYETQSHENVSDAMRVAVLMKHSPPSVRSAMRTASLQIGNGYEKAKKFIRDFLQSGHFYGSKGETSRDDGGAAPMDVGAISKGEKGKKGKKGKSDKGVSKGGKFDKSFGSGKGSSKKFQGECSHCGKWGHKKADCRILAKEKGKKEKEKGGSSTNSVSQEPRHEASSAAGSASPKASGSTNAVYYQLDPEGDRRPWAETYDIEEEYGDHTWVMAVTQSHERQETLQLNHQGCENPNVKYVLWDSGSDENLCRSSFGGPMHTCSTGRKLTGISGIDLGKLGSKKVRYKMLGENGKFAVFETNFLVSDSATKDVLSAGKMNRGGLIPNFQDWRNPYLEHHQLDFKIPLYMFGSSYYVKVIDDMAVPSGGRPKGGGAVVAPVSAQGDEYAWEFAGADADEEGLEAVPVPDQFARDEAHARADRQKLHGWSKVADLRARLKELDEPIYGDKHTLWKRLQKAEAQLNARRASARDYQEKHSERQQALREGRGGDVEMVPLPVGPTDEEREKHNVTHLPPAAWCEFCVRGHGMDDPHRRRTTEQKLAENHFELDYSFLKTDTSLAERFEESSDTVLSIVDSGTGMALAFSIPGKNLELPYVVRVITSFIAQLGYTTVKLRTDNEPVIKKVVRQIAEALRTGKAPGAEGLRVMFEEVPRYSSQSLGTMGAFQKLLREDVLTMRYAVEAEYGMTIHTSHNLWPWMVRWCSFLRSRFAVKANQRTAYQNAFDTSYSAPILPFAETVLFKVPVSKARRSHSRSVITKGDTTWRPGIFLGRSVTSTEYLLGTEEGTVSARSVRRFVDSGRRHDKALLSKMVGVPWDQGTTIGRPKRQIEPAVPPTPRMLPVEGAPEPLEDAERPDVNSGPSSASGLRRSPLTPNLVDARAPVEPARSGEAPVEAAADKAEADSAMTDVAPSTEQQPSVLSDSPTRLSARRAWAEEGGENPKRARVGEMQVSALYSPTEDIVVAEEEVEEAAADSDDERRPLTEEEEREGKMAEYDKMDFYSTYTPVKFEKGMKLLDAVWVNKRKPDGSVRCRYCVREFKRGDPRTDVFAVASSTSTSRLIDIVGVKKGHAFLTADAENAFWQVPIQEEVYMKAPKEWLEERVRRGDFSLHDHIVWKLEKEWYGRRKAGQSFVEWAAGKVVKIGLNRNAAAPWLFHDPVKDILMEVHMDDFYATGPEKALRELEEKLHSMIKLKSVIHPQRPGEMWTHLKRTRHVRKDGIFLTPRKKYIEDLLSMLHLEACNPAPTPYIHGEVKGGNKLDEVGVKVFRGGVGLALYLSYDRADIQFAVRELTKDMKDPDDGSMMKLHRLARYLKGTQDYGVWLPKSGELDKLTIHSDTDWANCKKTRKSCACAMFMAGDCLIFSYARSLQMLCLSSGEAEFNGGVAACSEGLFIKEIFHFFGIPLAMEVHLDSSAARGVFQRQGVGRIRHLEVKSLWVQEALARKLFSLHAVSTHDNTADFGTKVLSMKRFHELRRKLLIGSLEENEKQDNVSAIQFGSASANAIQIGSVSKQALMVALLNLVQGADGTEVIEPYAVTQMSQDVMSTVGSRITEDALILVGILLLIQFVMLLFVVAGMRLCSKWGLSGGKKVDASVQVELNIRMAPVFHLEGRDVYHTDTTCPALGQRTRPFDRLRPCLRCPRET